MFRRISRRLSAAAPTQGGASKPIVRIEPSKTLENVTIMALNLPPVNILTLPLLQAINTGLKEHAAEANPTKGIIITSDVPNDFSAGLDLDVLYSDLSEEVFMPYWSAFQEMWMLLQSYPKPLVAGINGHCAAAGCILSLACDYRVMARSSRPTVAGPGVDPAAVGKVKKYTMGITAARAGFAAPYWLDMSMKEVIGSRHAERLMTTGELVQADVALNVGLVDDLVAYPDEVDAACHKIMKQFLSLPSEGPRWVIKDLMRRPLTILLDTEEKRKRDAEMFFQEMRSPPVRAQLGAYLEKLHHHHKPHEKPDTHP